MPLKFHFHPLASFCWKPLIALYENATPFEPVVVDLADPDAVAAFKRISPMAKMPALVDVARGRTVLESTIVIEYLDAFYPGRTRLLPADADTAWQVRMWDRFYDHYLQHPMQKVVLDRLRPSGGSDPFGVEQARAQIREAYAVVEREMAGRVWAVGDAFTLADCAAAPALLYADTIAPLAADFPNALAYLDRLKMRPSFARVLKEAEPYFVNFPMDEKPRIAPTAASGRGTGSSPR